MGLTKKIHTGLLSLTPSEIEVLKFIGEGMDNDEIAKATFRSYYTVRSHVKSIYSKLGVSSRSKLVAYAIKNLDCAQLAYFSRYELIQLGFPKAFMKFGIFKRADGANHVVLILDHTEQLFKGEWVLMEIKP